MKCKENEKGKGETNLRRTGRRIMRRYVKTKGTVETGTQIEKVTVGMENIAAITEENSAAAEEIAASTEEMSSSAQIVSASTVNLSTLMERLVSKSERFTL